MRPGKIASTPAVLTAMLRITRSVGIPDEPWKLDFTAIVNESAKASHERRVARTVRIITTTLNSNSTPPPNVGNVPNEKTAAAHNPNELRVK